ncbi:gliding-associated putative ABC transporter substrate-binding component GldG [Pseudopedobacter saltans DSM 12145]|uniref:Gliding-associated putative ABC transporter substrate-binding component GldG n=1 Tax=Pseudopedobacter saltans (strain ATCC 51119 / DSM 12145 / JCM 21818 / CCUG 39354 / LMG 10337 / NBRC 100064 / NCIMB 13643) TaxID=762903 RepID=F0S6H6_PSESL|nr:gliding motility-associated ABC transporter substrate-binding protein GldG [Pseudopedobacter saltans]ADY54302.1 gliding-associated putative ABC transporter substrate-binding component GldG [Pseudopedobacter saltans DSM 12145]
MVNQKKKDIQYLLVALVAIAVLNILSGYFFTRIDFTAEKRFTLSAVTRGILKDIKKPIRITVFLDGEFPAGFKRLQKETRDILYDLKAYSSANIEIDFIDPSWGRNEQEQQAFFEELYQRGLEPTNLSVKTDNGLSQKIIFPGALVSYDGNEIPVKLLQSRMGIGPDEVLNNSIQNLEYAFISAIKKVISGGKPRVAFTEGHGELSDTELQDAMRSLSDGYEVGRIDLSEATQEGLNKLAALIIPKPNTGFSELEKIKIDQFLVNGGKVFLAIDQVHAELDSMQRGAGEQLAFQRELNLDDQLFKYGVRVNYDLIGDMNCLHIPLNVGNVGGQGQIQMVPWLFYPIIMPLSNHPLVKNLEGIKTQFISSIDTIETKGLVKQVLLKTSPFNRTLQAPTLISLNMVEEVPDPQKFRSEPKAVSVLVEGKFESVFKNRPIPEGFRKSDFKERNKTGKLLVFSDGDVLRNQIGQDGSVFPLGFDRYTSQTFGNKTFLLNIVDYFADDADLISLRSKEIKLRLLDKGKLKEQKLNWQIINTVVPVALLILFGIFQHIYRKRKYAS